MRIGLIGAGRLAGVLAQHWVRAGHELCVSSRHPDQLGAFAEALGGRGRAGTPADAAAFGDVVVLAVPLGATRDLGRELDAALGARVLVDATNPFPKRDGSIADEVLRCPRGSLGHTRRCFPSARVVKAFNTQFVSTLRRGGEGLAMPIAGDLAARETAEVLVRDTGFEPVWVGGDDHAGWLDPGGPLWNCRHTAETLRAGLADLSPS